MRKIVCVLNGTANSDQAQAVCKSVADSFAAKGVAAEIKIARTGEDVTTYAKAAVADGASVVAAGGGDGTQNAVASVLVGTDVTMGVLPMGTLNHFAKDMGIPLEIEKAVETIIAGATTRIDVGKVNDRIFLNNASLGLYPRIVRQREILQRQGWGKWLAFVRASLSTIARYASLRAQLKTGRHGDINQKTPFVFIGNNEYLIEGSNLGQRKRLDAGSLWVYRATQTTRLQLLWLFVAQVSGMGRGRQLKVFDTRQLQIEAPEPYLEIGLDGEVVRLATPLAIEILPSALQVVIPATAD